MNQEPPWFDFAVNSEGELSLTGMDAGSARATAVGDSHSVDFCVHSEDGEPLEFRVTGHAAEYDHFSDRPARVQAEALNDHTGVDESEVDGDVRVQPRSVDPSIARERKAAQRLNERLRLQQRQAELAQRRAAVEAEAKRTRDALESALTKQADDAQVDTLYHDWMVARSETRRLVSHGENVEKELSRLRLDDGKSR